MTGGDWFDELAEFLRIQSISADPGQVDEVWHAGEWVRQFVTAAGGSGELVDWQGQPLAVCELPASQNPASAPTVICYGHFDVQPPDPLELWESPPFEPEIRGEYLYGRGVADDKGQLYLLLSAARELVRVGQLPVNTRFVCDGEEETGGNSIVEFLDADDRPAAAAVIFDSLMLGRGMPAFNIATRGILYFHVELRTGASDLHSGLYGGAALNAAHALVQALQAVTAVDGRLPEPLRAGIAPLSSEEHESWQNLPSGASELAARGAVPADRRAADEFYVRTLAEPSLDINGIQTGSPTAIKTIVPAQAAANVSIRLAPGQQPEEIAAAFTRLLNESAPAGAKLDVQLLSSVPPSITSPTAEAVKLGLKAFERVVGTRPALVRSGGTLPVASVLANKGVATIISGFALPDANIHSPNERLLADYVPLGIAAAAELFREFGSLRSAR